MEGEKWGDFGAGFPVLKPEWRGQNRLEAERMGGMCGTEADLVDDRSGGAENPDLEW